MTNPTESITGLMPAVLATGVTLFAMEKMLGNDRQKSILSKVKKVI